MVSNAAYKSSRTKYDPFTFPTMVTQRYTHVTELFPYCDHTYMLTEIYQLDRYQPCG